MRSLTIVLLIFPIFSFAGTSFKVMTYNTMCFFCGSKKDYGPYKTRMMAIADTINRHAPSLIGLQEFTFKNEVSNLIRKLKLKYAVVFNKGLVPYGDSVLLVDKIRFEILERGSFWLGPNRRYPIGWRKSFPRQLVWVKIFDRERHETFIFAGSHFDNDSDNKNPSAIIVNEFLSRFDLPVLFVGDTNLNFRSIGHNNLMKDLFQNTFQGSDQTKFYANSPYEKQDGCMSNKKEAFPDCLIDHILISEKNPNTWHVKSWGIDLYKYQGLKNWSSDHRAVIVEIE